MIRLLKSCEPSRHPASRLPKWPARMCPRAHAGARLHECRAPAAQWLVAIAIADTGLRSCVIIVITVGMIHFYFGYGYWP